MQNPREREEQHIASKKDERSFWKMVALAAQNAFNDKAAQFFLIPLAAWLVIKSGEGGGGDMKYVLGALIVAPFIFLSPVAGWISDRFSKTSVMRAGMVLQLGVLALITLGVYLQDLKIGILGFFLLAIQSTILSPAKKGLVKEMVGSEKLGFASGVLEMASVLAICAGQIVSGFWFDSRLAQTGDGWSAALTPLMILSVLAIPAVIVSFTMKLYPSPSKREFRLNILWEHFGQLGDLFKDRRLKWSAMGVAFFWFFGGFINLVAVQLAETITDGNQGFGSEMAWFLAAASGGIVLGGLLGSIGCRRNIELGLVPIGSLITVAGCVAMAFTPLESIWMKVWMVFAGVGGALFLVPLNAYVQDLVDPAKRGRVLAGINLLDCLAGAGAVAFQLALSKFGVPMSGQFMAMAALTLIVTGFSTKLLPQHFVRFTLLSVFRIFYRQKVLHAERMPDEGGVLIVPNHVTYIDAFILTAASPRPIRFLMHDNFFKRDGVISKFVKIFDTVPISPTKAKEAIHIAAEAVSEGAVVCIFPEGQLTRSGAMLEMKRGFEMIARKSKCVVMPVYMDGLWGSIFSFERGKLFKKVPYSVPYGVTVAWGEPMESGDASSGLVRQALHQLSAEAIAMREILHYPGRLLDLEIEPLNGVSDLWTKMLAEVRSFPEKKQRAILTNALQVSESPAFSKNGIIVVDGTTDLAPLFSIGLMLVHRVRVILTDKEVTAEMLREWDRQYEIEAYVGGENLYAVLKETDVQAGVYYHTRGLLDHEEVLPCFPIGVVEGCVVSISTEHPYAISETNQFQAGWIDGSIGRLLPGFSYTNKSESSLELHSPAFGNEGGQAVELKGRMDASGFLYLSE
ncbi:MFS transporter [Rubritalea sp.]|uniref:MFS transporter n=1 Tax=Rubritalea sp. TaxID=2109375 RepID=UPI003EFAB2A6